MKYEKHRELLLDMALCKLLSITIIIIITIRLFKHKHELTSTTNLDFMTLVESTKQLKSDPAFLDRVEERASTHAIIQAVLDILPEQQC